MISVQKQLWNQIFRNNFMLENTFKTNTTDATLTDIFSKTDMYLGGVLNEEELLQFIAISAGARLAVIKDQKRQK